MTINPADEAARLRPLRAAVLAIAAAGTLFWFYTFYYIAQLPMGDGTGMQWVAEAPLTVIFFLFTFPALIIAPKGRMLKTALVLGCIGLIAFGLLWWELLGEFHHT